jgi:hypothetical protein
VNRTGKAEGNPTLHGNETIEKKLVKMERKEMKSKIGRLLLGLVVIVTTMTMSSLSATAGGGTPGQHPMPVAVLVGPKYAYTGDNVVLDGSGSHVASPYYITQYDFDYGQGGGWHGWQDPSTATVTYTTGAYTAKLKVMDNASDQSVTTSKTVFVNGDYALNPYAVDKPGHVWTINNPVDFDVTVQDKNGGDAYWVNITHVYIYDWQLNIYTEIQNKPKHWESATQPLLPGGAPAVFNYTGAWQTNENGLYYIRMQCYDGNSTAWSDLHAFWVFK